MTTTDTESTAPAEALPFNQVRVGSEIGTMLLVLLSERGLAWLDGRLPNLIAGGMIADSGDQWAMRGSALTALIELVAQQTAQDAADSKGAILAALTA